MSGSLKFTVWPYFFFSGLSGLVALWLVVMVWPANYPAKSELVKLNGKIATVSVRGDFSNTKEEAITPFFTSVYFTLEGVQGEFRYPFSHPKYVLVRDYTSRTGSLDIWVDSSELENNPTMTIWQLQEHSKNNRLYPETSVTYEEVVTKHTRVNRSNLKLSFWLAIVCGILALVGFGMQRWNQFRHTQTKVKS